MASSGIQRAFSKRSWARCPWAERQTVCPIAETKRQGRRVGVAGGRTGEQGRGREGRENRADSPLRPHRKLGQRVPQHADCLQNYAHRTSKVGYNIYKKHLISLSDKALASRTHPCRIPIPSPVPRLSSALSAATAAYPRKASKWRQFVSGCTNERGRWEEAGGWEWEGATGGGWRGRDAVNA